MITCKVETIDRETAEKYENTDKGNNRAFSKAHLADLVSRQIRGEWKINGDTIRFDSKGQLRDGQHRLRMVKVTGIPIEVIVVRGIDPDAFSTMDVGKKRSFGDVLSIKHEPHPMQLAPTVSMVWRYLSRRMREYAGTSYEEMQKVLEAHPEIRDSVEFYSNIKRPASVPGFFQVSMACHYLFTRIDKIKADDFFIRYVTGLYAEEADDPVHVTREQVISFAMGRRRMPPNARQVFALICKAWNLYQAGESLKKKLTLPDLTDIAKAPKINGFPRALFIEQQGGFPENLELEENSEL